MPASTAPVRRIRLVIADRRPIVLEGFASLLAAQPYFEVIASCLDGASCLEAVRNLSPDVVLVEDGFSDVTASEMLAVATTENLPARFVFYTASVARGDVASAIATGACNAISMREKPETLLQRLRLLAPIASRAEDNGAFGENGLPLLTDHERKIMRLVACGMSNREIGRQLKVSTATVKAHLDQIFAQLEIKNRKELATFTLSRLYGGVGALAALIFAALDDVHAASETTVGAHDTFTVKAADGTSAVMTVTVCPKKTAAVPGKTANAGRFAKSVIDTPMRAGQPIEVSDTIIPLPALNPPRPGLGNYGAFMLATAGVWIYELLNNAAQAFSVRNSLSDLFGSSAANGTSELVVHNIPGSADAKLDGFDNVAWLNPGIHHDSFAFETPRRDAIGTSDDEVQIIEAAADEDSASDNGNPHVGSGAVDALIDYGSFKQATATDESRNQDDTIQAIAGDGSIRDQSQRDLHTFEEGAAAGKPHVKDGPPGRDPNHGQSQRDLHASKDGVAAGKPHVKNEPPGHDPNHGQSQRDLHASEDGVAAGKSHVKNEPPGHDPNHGQSQRDLHASEGGAAAGKPHVKDAPPGHDPNHEQSQRDLHASADGSATAKQHVTNDVSESHANPGQSQRDLHEAHSDASRNLHAGRSQNAVGNDQATDDSGQAQKAAAPQPGDSFHFKNDVAATKGPDILEVHIGHGHDNVDIGLHNDGVDGTLIQDADLIGPSHAEQSTIDHSRGVEHHLAHDLFV